MALNILYALFALFWVFMLPTYFTRRIFLRDIESPAGRTGLALIAVMVLLPIATFGLASLMSRPMDHVMIFVVATAWNIVGLLHQGAAYRRRVRED